MADEARPTAPPGPCPITMQTCAETACSDGCQRIGRPQQIAPSACEVTGEHAEDATTYRHVREELEVQGRARVFGRLADEPRFRWLDLCPEHADSSEGGA